jgi:tetratricopeptide (TPR) repeat protein
MRAASRSDEAGSDVSKATIVRKKALDLVRQQDWQGAVKEYKRLVEMDQSNPNVHNELADIYLKTGSKAEAYDCFVRAIDEYTRVGLYNNAVAVAKKVMRVLPARNEVLTLLGNVRMKQGLTREAESYYTSFLEKVVGSSVDPPAFKKIAHEIADAAPDSIPVLQKLSQCLISFQLDEEAGEVIVKLHGLLERSGNAAALEDVRASAEKLGLGAKLQLGRSTAAPDPNRTVVTENNIWTETHSAGERIEIESTPHFTPPAGQDAAPAPAKGPAAPAAPAQAAGPSERELYLLRLARGVGGSPPKQAPAPAAPAVAAKPAEPAVEPEPVAAAPVAEPVPAKPVIPVVEEPVAAQGMPEDEPGEQTDAAEAAAAATATLARPAAKPAAAAKAAPAARPTPAPPARPASGDHTQISALIDDDFGGGQGEDDYRSHYDLGMAYMEMDLLSEAIREYQVASRSPQFQVKCLEMIGLCFVRQNQPQLAIKQLSKGLAMIGTDSEESLGMKYNLGLAYEMVGDFAAARVNFEDVYVVDVTFRDVAEKVAKLASKS